MPASPKTCRASRKDFAVSTKTMFILLAVSAASVLGTAQASSSDRWAELMQRASAACAKASDLRNPVTGKPVDFSDKVLVIVEGT